MPDYKWINAYSTVDCLLTFDSTGLLTHFHVSGGMAAATASVPPDGISSAGAGHPGVAAASRGTTANLLINSQIKPVILWF